MAFRAVSGNTTSSASSIVDKPTGTIDGDVVILIAASGTAADITFPVGFTELTPIQITTTNYNAQFEVAWKIASSEGANYTIGGTGTKISAAISFSGRNSSAVESSSSNSNSTTVASPFAMTGTSITPTTGSDVLWVGLFRFNAVGEPADGVTTPPTGYTLAGNYTVSSGRGIALAYKENVSAGATGDLTASGAAGTFDDRSAVTGAYIISLSSSASGDTPGLKMKMFANGDVQIANMVELSGATNKLYANGTYVTSQFIEV